ncbi:hypothetical protein RAM80_12050 [Pseudomonas sp. App30]|uniref:hypothetical protein n=1 Tax=Pseudomonas sp. App30 TaxID=3068990 RepID=UPI003A7FCA04
MHSRTTTHRESPLPLPRALSQALEHQVLDIDGDIKAIAQVPGSDQWLVAIDSGYGFCVARLHADLTLDDSFGLPDRGYFFDTFDTASFAFTAVNQLAWVGDKVLVVGATCDFDVDRIALARYHADGRPDLSFNGDGKHILELPHSRRRPRKQRSGTTHSAIFTPQTPVVLADGGVVLFFLETCEQHPEGRAFLVRLDASGALDTGFNQQGFAQVQFEGRTVVPRGVVRQGNDLLLYGATCPDDEGATQGLIARFDANGHRDMTFNGTGFIVIGDACTRTVLSQVSVDEHHEIYAAGTFGSELLVTRRRADGSPHADFNTGVPLLVTLPFEVTGVKAVARQGDALLLAATAGASEYKGTLVRLAAEGALDTAFADGAGYLMAEHESEYLALGLERDGTIIAAGYLYQQGYYAWVRRFDCNALRPVQRPFGKERQRYRQAVG